MRVEGRKHVRSFVLLFCMAFFYTNSASAIDKCNVGEGSLEQRLSTDLDAEGAAKTAGIDPNSAEVQAFERVNVAGNAEMLDAIFSYEQNGVRTFYIELTDGKVLKATIEDGAMDDNILNIVVDGKSREVRLDTEVVRVRPGERGVWLTLPEKAGLRTGPQRPVGAGVLAESAPFKNGAGNKFTLTSAKGDNHVFFQQKGKSPRLAEVQKIYVDGAGNPVKVQLGITDEAGNNVVIITKDPSEIASITKVKKSDSNIHQNAQGDYVNVSSGETVSYKESGDPKLNPRTEGKVANVFTNEDGSLFAVVIESETTTGERSFTTLTSKDELASLRSVEAPKPIDSAHYEAKTFDGVKAGEKYEVKVVGDTGKKKTLEIRRLDKKIGEVNKMEKGKVVKEPKYFSETVTIDLNKLAEFYSAKGRKISADELAKMPPDELAILYLGEREKWFNKTEIDDIGRFLSKDKEFMSRFPCSI